MAKLFHPLLTLIASATDRELAKYVQFLKEESKILRSRFGTEAHTRPDERQRLLQFGKALGRVIEKLIPRRFVTQMKSLYDVPLTAVALRNSPGLLRPLRKWGNTFDYFSPLFDSVCGQRSPARGDNLLVR